MVEIQKMERTDHTDYTYLDNDPEMAGQKYCCISFATDENGNSAVKVRGSFETEDAAQKHAMNLQRMFSNFHIYVAQVGYWLPVNPDPNDIQDQKYQNEKLDEIMRGLHDNQVYARQQFEERKQAMVTQAKLDGTREGQARLANKKEPIQSVYQRHMILKEDLDTLVARMREVVAEVKRLDGELDERKDELEEARRAGQMIEEALRKDSELRQAAGTNDATLEASAISVFTDDDDHFSRKSDDVRQQLLGGVPPQLTEAEIAELAAKNAAKEDAKKASSGESKDDSFAAFMEKKEAAEAATEKAEASEQVAADEESKYAAE